MTKISDRSLIVVWSPNSGERLRRAGSVGTCASSWGTDPWYRRPVKLRTPLMAPPYETTRTVYRK